MKYAKSMSAPAEAFDDSDPAGVEVCNADGTPKMLVTIGGLRQVVGDSLFELSGVAPRNIDWTAVKFAFGFEGDEAMPGALCEQLADVIWDYDIREVLAKRIRRAR